MTDHPEGVRSLFLSTALTRTLGYGVHVFRAGDFLIDCGFRYARRHLLSSDLLDGAAACLLTHHHEDHAGNAAALIRRGLPVRAPAPVAARIAAGERLHAYQRAMWGTPEPVRIETLDGAAVGGGWRLAPVSTPGHAPVHYIYHEPGRGLVFAGDLYLARRVPVARPDEDLTALLQSLRTIRDLRPRVLFCAHRGRIDRPESALSVKIGWIEDLIAGAVRLRERGASTRRIARELLGREGATWVVTAGDLSRRTLIDLALRAARERDRSPAR